MRNEALALLLAALVVPAAGCASKDYVREVVGQSQAKLDAQLREQGQILSAQVKRLDAETGRAEAQAKQLDEMGGRFAKLETSVDEFGNISRRASAKADEAVARAEEIQTRVSRLLTTRGKRRLVETIQVHFGLDRSDLTDASQTALAALIRELAENPALTVDLQGYTDSTGPVEYNLELSDRRVSSVRRFLAAHGVDLSRINWIGMGMLQDRGSPAERAQNRRVTLRLMLPDEGLGPQQSSATPAESRPAAPAPKAPEPAAAAASPAPAPSPQAGSPTAEEPKAPEPPGVAPASNEEGGAKPKDASQ
jgi:outer membrane protein OmpA-like peptidoglycan-associated protein